MRTENSRRHGADGVPKGAEHTRALVSEEIAAADQIGSAGGAESQRTDRYCAAVARVDQQISCMVAGNTNRIPPR